MILYRVITALCRVIADAHHRLMLVRSHLWLKHVATPEQRRESSAATCAVLNMLQAEVAELRAAGGKKG